MKQRFLQNQKAVITATSSALLGGSLSMLCLMNLPAFYEMSEADMVRTFLIVSVAFGILSFFFTNWFVIPYMRAYWDRRSALLLVGLAAILFASFVFSSPYFWTIPQIQKVAICYRSASASERLDVLEAHDVQNNREYPPESLGSQRYPIQIAANTCIEGTEIALTALDRRDSSHGLGITVSQKDDQQHITLELNNSRKSSGLGDHDGIPGTERVSVDVDAEKRDTYLTDPWGRKWMVVARWASIGFASAYIALFLLGISETILLHSDPL